MGLMRMTDSRLKPTLGNKSAFSTVRANA